MISITDSKIFSLDTENIKIKEFYIGNLDNKIILVDNFFKYPHEVQQYALSCKYVEPMIGSNPGYVHHYNLNPLEFIDFCNYLRSHYYHNYTPPREDNTFTFQVYKNIPKMLPHIDYVEFAGVCCLNDSKEMNKDISGTSFFRYKNGSEYSFNDSYRNNILKTSNLSDWEIYHTQYHKFNQYIFYESCLFHSAYCDNDRWISEIPRLTFNTFTW